tara:strand:+ start:243 stop:416 length:174 start_codon:yes stop_codon:yes gene_type:complete
VTKEKIQEKIDIILEQQQDAQKNFNESKLIFDKCQGALEVLYILLEEEEDKKDTKKK